MRPQLFTSNTVAQLLQRKTVATMDELSAELAPCSSRTVHRKLKNLNYLSSYSHRGKYYTLFENAAFNVHGLWEYKEIQFSQHGTLYNTVQKLVEASRSGYRSAELDAVLNVRTANALGKLVHEGTLSCVFIEGRKIFTVLWILSSRHSRWMHAGFSNRGPYLRLWRRTHFPRQRWHYFSVSSTRSIVDCLPGYSLCVWDMGEINVFREYSGSTAKRFNEGGGN